MTVRCLQNLVLSVKEVSGYCEWITSYWSRLVLLDWQMIVMRLCVPVSNQNQIKFILLKNSLNIITVERKTVSRKSKAEVELTAVLDRRTDITRLHINYC